MIGLTIDQAKGLFFDRYGVQGAIDRATAKALSRFGAFVRTRAKSSIRKRKKISEPGQPPSSHVGLLKQFIFFVFEPKAKSVVIGPAKLNQHFGNAPEALERGVPSVVRRWGFRRKDGTLVRPQTRQVFVRPRPFMKPAFDAELPGAPRLWENQAR